MNNELTESKYRKNNNANALSSMKLFLHEEPFFCLVFKG